MADMDAVEEPPQVGERLETTGVPSHVIALRDGQMVASWEVDEPVAGGAHHRGRVAVEVESVQHFGGVARASKGLVVVAAREHPRPHTRMKVVAPIAPHQSS